jgi:hypothetical protein
MPFRKRSLAWLLSLTLLGCADEGGAKSDFPGAGDENSAGDGDGDDGDGDEDGDELPPEMEDDTRFDTPRAGKNVVYVPNPLTNRVAVVHATTFAVEIVETGRGPTYTATVPGQDVALVLNVASRDAALLRTDQGKTTARRLDVGHDANAIAVAPDGRHAVVYFDAARGEGEASTFQDVTVVRLVAGQESSRGVSVGFRPRAVQFSADGKRAFVVTEDGVSIVDLDAAVEGPVIAELVPVGDQLGDAVSSDVQVTPNGKYALARREGQSEVRLVDLASGAIQALDLARFAAVEEPDGGVDGGTSDGGTLDGGAALPAAALTDLDLAPGGAFALGVLRSASTLLRIPIPGGFADPASIDARVIDEQRIGSVSIAPSGRLAVLYTTADSRVESVVIVDLESDAARRGVRLRKAVRGVVLSADGTRAIVLHAPSSIGAQGEEARIDGSEGYSLVDTTTGFAKLKLTDAEVGELGALVTPDARRMFALLRDDAGGVFAYETADLGSFQVQTHVLTSPPSSLGIVPSADRVFIGQDVEGGMISFLDAATGELVRPVAGFELISRIRQ